MATGAYPLDLLLQEVERNGQGVSMTKFVTGQITVRHYLLQCTGLWLRDTPHAGH